MSRRILPTLVAAVALAFVSRGAAQSGSAQPAAAAAIEQLSFEEAVRRSQAHHPSVGQAAQAILRAQALLDQAKSVFRPQVYGAVGTTILDDARGFDGNITQPRTQTAMSATLSFPLLATARWAAKNQAADQVGTARVSAEETRRQVALVAAQSYLAVIAAQRQREIAVRNRDTASALADYARTRLEAGQGSRLNALRASQELAAAEAILQATELLVRRVQEALGVAIFAEGPIDAIGEPALPSAVVTNDDTWLARRPDVRLFAAQLNAADRVVSDSWKSWLPTATAWFTPQYVTPAGFFEPARSWRASFQVQVPVYDGTLGAAKRMRVADRETARLRLHAVEIEARSELRLAQEAVSRNQLIVAATRQAAESAGEVLRIAEIAYRAGATTNIEVVQAQQTARNADGASAQAEDRLRLARLDLLVALGRFPE